MSRKTALKRSLSRHILLCGIMSLALGISVVGWAAATTLAGAVVAPGTFVVETYVKAVQHPTGGVVGSLFVKEGQKVEAGEILLTLDDTEARTNLAIVTKRHNELTSRLERLRAERDDMKRIAFSKRLLALSERDADVREAVRSENFLFAFRRNLRDSKKAQLRERIAQYRHEIDGYSTQRSAYTRALDVLEDEIASLKPLYTQKLVSVQRLSALEREAASFEGDRGEATAAAAQAAGRIAEAELQILQIEQDFKTEVGRSLSEVQMEIGELVERKHAAEEELRRIDIRAPQSGTVHQLAVHTVGGVVSPADRIMLVVPENDSLSLDVRVMPEDVDQLFVGQSALVRLSAFSQRTTPELNGRVERIAADLSEDPQTGTAFYLVRVFLPEAERKRLNGLVLVPGMPAETFIQTRKRTALSYLFKPLTDQVQRAFREE
ncbi:HlyD family type I secretion periplasmic adaptor subunit [Roseibium aggregatum]|uniref:Membrane fusion protein (MFP) family protein n=1 Tax=Roseibium aggregatum TaxID=187304 RepID=A0A939J3Q5_9HYPH|nr:HlyD family type I secretion periplasmic adaptor subunit [Roseibium aggregatum]MBN9672748.1 HlyD family type I secretion periplasmic adaptor subunit [Roseibium aggregatum]